MQLYTLTLACFNERGIEAGDVVNYRPAMLPWTGQQTLKRYLLVNVYYDENAISDITSPYYEGGALKSELPKPTIDKPFPDMPKVIKPFRFNISLDYLKTGWYPKLDLNQCVDLTVAYQPFIFEDVRIDTSEPVAVFYDKYRDSYKYATMRSA